MPLIDEQTGIDLSDLQRKPFPLVDDQSGISLEGLETKAEEKPLELRPAPPMSWWQRFKDIFREDPAKLRAKAQNALTYSEAFGISPSKAYEYHDEISEQLGGEKLTTPELIGGLITLPVTAALASNPLGTLLGLATFEALSEAESAAVSLVKGEPYKAFQKKTVAELLPEDTAQITKEVIDTLDFIGKGLVAKGIFQRTPKLAEKFTKKIITEHKLPRKLYIDPAELKAELQRGNILSGEEMEIVKALGLKGSEYRTAVERGLHIEIPAERITVIRDRPWFAKVKKLLKIEPTLRKIVTKEGEVKYSFGEAKVLEKPKPVAPRKAKDVLHKKVEEIETETGAFPEEVQIEGYKDEVPFEVPEPTRARGVIQEYPPIPDEERVEQIAVPDYEQYAIGYVHALRTMVEQGEPGFRVKTVDYDGTESWSGYSSSYPDFMRDKGWHRLSVLGALKKGPKGEKLGKRESEIYAAALGQGAEIFIRDLESMGASDEFLDKAYDSIQPAIDKALNKAKMKEQLKKQAQAHLSKVRKALKAKKVKVAEAKKKIRMATGQVKIGDLISEQDALTFGLKKAEQAARKAYKEGSKEGVTQERARKKVLEAKLREKRELREHMKRLAKRIQRPVGTYIDFYYREAIENLQAGIDPSFRARKTLEQKERTKRYLASDPEKLKEIPVRLLRDLAAKPLNEYTIDELEQIGKEKERLYELGRLKRDMTLAREKREFEAERNEIVSTVMRGKELKLDKEPVVISTTVEGGVKKAIKVARAYSLRPMRIFDLFDNRANFQGKAHEVFYDRANEAENAKLRSLDARLEKGKAKLKELGLTLKGLTKTRIVEGTKYTVDEMIDVYVGFKNPRKKLAIMYGNAIDEPTGMKIIEKLTAKEKALGDFVVDEYDSNYSRLREAYIDYTNEDMGWEPSYTPMRRTGIDYKEMQAELADELLHRRHLKRGYAPRGMTIARKDIPPEYQRPIRLGAYATWLEQVPKQEHFISYGDAVRRLQRFMRDQLFREAVKSNFGLEYLDVVQKYVDRLGNPNIYRSFDAIENFSRTLRKNTAIAYLAYNLVTMGKQLPSVVLYLAEAGPVHLMATAAEFMAAPFKTIQFVKEHDPQMAHRSLERELEELKKLNKPGYDRIIAKVGKAGMIGIYSMDRIAITIGWKAVYNRYVHELGEAEAIRRALNATLRTQPAAHAKDVAQIYATNEFLNWMTQFTNQLSNIYNISTYDIPSEFIRGKYYKAFLGTFSLAVVATVIWMMTNRRVPEDAEDLKDAIKDEVLNAIPLVGRQISAMERGWYDSSPAMKGAEAAARLMTEADWKRKADAIIEAICVMKGVPYVGPKRVMEAAKEGKPELLLGKKSKK